ncbi:MAG: hypothetical protein R2940_14640 [Syntrophotaleaceae bacterium]
MFGRDSFRDIKTRKGPVLTLLGGALGATTYYTFRRWRKRHERKGREGLGQEPSREHIRMKPGD